MTALQVRAYGRPAPQGSHEIGANGYVMHSSNYLAAWRQAVNESARRAYLDAGLTGRDMPLIPYPRPVYLAVAHWVLDEQCRAEGTAEPTGSPDLDKLLRATIDGLGEARVFGNDSQVKAVMTSKVRGENAGADIIISDQPIGETEPMTQEYRICLERVGRDEAGDRTYDTVTESYGTADELVQFDLPGIAARLGRTMPASASEPEPATEPAKPTKRAPKKAVPSPEPAPTPAPPTPVAQVVSETAQPAPQAAPVNPFAR